MDRLLLTFSYIHIKNDSDYVSPNGEDLYSHFEKIFMHLRLPMCFDFFILRTSNINYHQEGEMPW
jgi:hypothetical protein